MEDSFPACVMPEVVPLSDLDIPVSIEETVYTELESVIDIPETFVLTAPEKRYMPFRGEESLIGEDSGVPTLTVSDGEDVIFVEESLPEVKVVRVKQKRGMDDDGEQDTGPDFRPLRARELGSSQEE